MLENHYKKLNQINKSFIAPKNTEINPKPSQLPSASSSEDHVPEKSYFNVFFSKDLKKKHKIFDEGILVISSNNCFLYNSEGSKIFEIQKVKNIHEMIKSEEPIILGYSYYVEINKPVTKEFFESGQAFFQYSTSIAADPPKIIGKQKKMQTKIAIPTEIPIDSYIICESREELNPNTCYIEPFLAKIMRPHQKEGVKFMFENVCGFKGTTINGCILADSMGLGKTLQSIALIWTLLRQNPFVTSQPFVKKVIIITPVSLVKNWEKEIQHWLGSQRLIPLVAIGTRDEVLKSVVKFCEAHYRCLILSYESFRVNVERLADCCDLFILDEGHRLKNMNIKTFQTFSKVKCTKRIILTGTPLQNSFDEFYSCLSFVNPNLFSSLNTFRKVFSNPILESFKKEASEEVKNLARERSKELSKIVSSIVLRRQPTILEKTLPPRHEFLIFLRLTEIQSHIYQATIKEKVLLKNLLENKVGEALPFIMVLRKILNHPHLLMKDDSELSKQIQKYLFQKSGELTWDASNKFKFVRCLLLKIKVLNDLKEKIIIVSYFSQTLDLVQDLCQEIGLKTVRLDGIQVFLLCAKAGGTGLNLIGGNRMVLLEVDWNPSNDLQVMGRIWREGQKKPVFIYRLLISGTLEEKILQRQIMKGNLAENVVDEKFKEYEVDCENIKKLFEIRSDSECETFAYEENEIFELLNLSEDFSEDMTDYITFIKEKKNSQLMKEGNENTMKNLFEEENAFIGMMKTEKETETKENAEGENTERQKEHIDIPKEESLTNPNQNPTNKENEAQINDDKKVGVIASIENSETNSKKRKFPNENILKIFAKIKKNE